MIQVQKMNMYLRLQNWFGRESVYRDQKLPKIEANFTNFEVWSSKTELPKIEITNIEGYQYRGIPVVIKLWTS